MALQPPKYTARQRAAIVWNVLDGTPPISTPEACRRAAAGQLRDAQGALDAWAMHPGTARDLVARERRRRDAARRRVAGPNADAQEIAAAVLEEARDLTRRMRRRRAKLTPREIRDAAAMARECIALARDAGFADTDAPPALPAPATDTGALAAAAAEIAAADPPPPEPPSREHGDNPDAGTTRNA